MNNVVMLLNANIVPNISIDLVVHDRLMALDEVYQRVAYVHLPSWRPQQHVVLTLGVAKLEE